MPRHEDNRKDTLDLSNLQSKEALNLNGTPKFKQENVYEIDDNVIIQDKNTSVQTPTSIPVATLIAIVTVATLMRLP